MSARTQARPERPRPAADVLAPLGSVLQEQDTRRVDLAQRLHRDVAGGLVACTTMSEMIRYELRHAGDSDALSTMLTNLESALRHTIQVVRDITGEQLPSVLKTFGIGGALRQLAEDAGGIVALSLAGDEPALTLSQRLGLHHILSALIHRIRSHAGATHIEVIGSFEPSRMEILIEHDGADVMRSLSDTDTALAAVKGRIAHLGARLLVSRNAGGATRSVRLVMPLPITTDDIPTTTPHPASLP